MLKTTARTTASVLLLLSVSVSAYSLPVDNLFGSLLGRSGAPGDDMTIEHALERVASQINRNLPLEVDDETRLDKVTHESGRLLTYHYTLVTQPGSQIDKANFQKLIQPLLKKKLCESEDMKRFLKNGVSIAYSYRGKDVQPVGSFKYAPADCGYKTRFSAR